MAISAIKMMRRNLAAKPRACASRVSVAAGRRKSRDRTSRARVPDRLAHASAGKRALHSPGRGARFRSAGRGARPRPAAVRPIGDSSGPPSLAALAQPGLAFAAHANTTSTSRRGGNLLFPDDGVPPIRPRSRLPELSPFGMNVYAYTVTVRPYPVQPQCRVFRARYVPLRPSRDLRS